MPCVMAIGSRIFLLPNGAPYLVPTQIGLRRSHKTALKRMLSASSGSDFVVFRRGCARAWAGCWMGRMIASETLAMRLSAYQQGDVEDAGLALERCRFEGGRLRQLWTAGQDVTKQIEDPGVRSQNMTRSTQTASLA
jgi:hypothetical protein